jgi:hypothetical protein
MHFHRAFVVNCEIRHNFQFLRHKWNVTEGHTSRSVLRPGLLCDLMIFFYFAFYLFTMYDSLPPSSLVLQEQKRERGEGFSMNCSCLVSFNFQCLVIMLLWIYRSKDIKMTTYIHANIYIYIYIYIIRVFCLHSLANSIISLNILTLHMFFLKKYLHLSMFLFGA